MIGAVARCVREKRAGLLLWLLALEGVLLFFQWMLTGHIKSERLQICETREEVFRKSSELLYKKGFLAHYEIGLAELEPVLPRNVEDASEAAAVLDDCLKSGGITAEIAATSLGEANIVMTADGVCPYAGLLGFLCRLSSIPYASRISDLLVERRGEQWVHFVVKINFVLIRTRSGVEQTEIK